MATTVWRGHLTFGLVSIPIRLFKAARSEKIRFHQLYNSKRTNLELPKHEPLAQPERPRIAEPPSIAELPLAPVEQYTRVRQNIYAPPDTSDAFTRGADAKPIGRTDLVKGYEYDKNQYVVIENEDLKKLLPQTATEMEILEFVKLEEIDPVHFETSYYVAPDEAGEKAYALLFQAMRETQFVALAEVAMHRKEHVMVLRPGTHGLLAHTMFYTDEIRQDQEYRTETNLVAGKELQMAKLLVQSLAAPFEPGKYKDKFREKLRAVIDAKVEGRQVAQTRETRKPAEVVDILLALEQSLKLVRKPAGNTASTGAQRKTRQRRVGS